MDLHTVYERVVVFLKSSVLYEYARAGDPIAWNELKRRLSSFKSHHPNDSGESYKFVAMNDLLDYDLPFPLSRRDAIIHEFFRNFFTQRTVLIVNLIEFHARPDVAALTVRLVARFATESETIVFAMRNTDQYDEIFTSVGGYLHDNYPERFSPSVRRVVVVMCDTSPRRERLEALFTVTFDRSGPPLGPDDVDRHPGFVTVSEGSTVEILQPVVDALIRMNVRGVFGFEANEIPVRFFRVYKRFERELLGLVGWSMHSEELNRTALNSHAVNESSVRLLGDAMFLAPYRLNILSPLLENFFYGER